jgi:hypothetical protein
MPDIYLRQGQADPNDILLAEGKAYIDGTSSGDQAAQTGSGTGVLSFIGTETGAQAAQTGDGSGTVYMTPVAAPEHLWGEWVNVNELILKKARELPPPPMPRPVSGYADGAQVAQSGAATGHVMERIHGKAKGRQLRQAGRAIGGVSMKAKNERELLELLLMEAA